jgi:hypothetical protein
MRKQLLFLVVAAILTGSAPQASFASQAGAAAQAASSAAQGGAVSPAETECYYCECNGGRCFCVRIECG